MAVLFFLCEIGTKMKNELISALHLMLEAVRLTQTANKRSGHARCPLTSCRNGMQSLVHCAITTPSEAVMRRGEFVSLGGRRTRRLLSSIISTVSDTKEHPA